MDFTQHSQEDDDQEMVSNSKATHPCSSNSSHQQMNLAPMSSWLGSYTNMHNISTATASSAQSDETNISIEKEHMFDKVVTPSDVGKLNRLVIPKQHAERYFPLDASTNEKGLLLNFEDANGKPWRFRYSYWNSSQSYVMTKGWSRFVKDKKLNAGDIVSFQRGVGELGKDRLYIDWRRRPDAIYQPSTLPSFGMSYPIHRSIPWSPLLQRPPGAGLPSSHFHSMNNVNFYAYGSSGANQVYGQGSNMVYMRPAYPALQQAVEPMVFDSVPVVQGKAAAKRMRLFGVNMECPISDDQDDDDEVMLSETIQPSQASNSSLQLRLHSGTPVQSNFQDKGKAPSSSSDRDM